jgi:hypothetical protein
VAQVLEHKALSSISSTVKKKKNVQSVICAYRLYVIWHEVGHSMRVLERGQRSYLNSVCQRLCLTCEGVSFYHVDHCFKNTNFLKIVI